MHQFYNQLLKNVCLLRDKNKSPQPKRGNAVDVIFVPENLKQDKQVYKQYLV